LTSRRYAGSAARLPIAKAAVRWASTDAALTGGSSPKHVLARLGALGNRDRAAPAVSDR
jgi:hypothetical protein